MSNMNKEEKKIIENEIRMIMQNAVSSEYARYILEHENEETERTFMEDVIEDVMCASARGDEGHYMCASAWGDEGHYMCVSAWDDEGHYNDDDIRLSIGRIFMERLGIEV